MCACAVNALPKNIVKYNFFSLSVYFDCAILEIIAYIIPCIRQLLTLHGMIILGLLIVNTFRSPIRTSYR